MSTPRSIALLGLPPPERALIEALVQLSASRGPDGYHIVNEVSQAQFVVANADDAVTLRDLRVRPPRGRVVLVGEHDGGTGWPLVQRPVRLHSLMETLRRQEAAPAPKPFDLPDADDDEDTRVSAFAHTRPFSPSELPDADSGFAATRQFDDMTIRMPPPAAFENTRPFDRQFDAMPRKAAAPVAFEQTRPFDRAELMPAMPVPSRAPVAAPPPAPAAVTAPAPPAPPAAPPAETTASSPNDDTSPAVLDTPAPPARRVRAADAPDAPRLLLVGDARADWALLTDSLRRNGYAVDFAPDRASALARVPQIPYAVVIVDQLFLGSEALPLCGALRHAQVEGNQPRARVLVLAKQGGLFNRFRAWFAGCDGWMVVPLRKGDLMRFLGRAGSNR